MRGAEKEVGWCLRGSHVYRWEERGDTWNFYQILGTVDRRITEITLPEGQEEDHKRKRGKREGFTSVATRERL